MHHFTKIDHLTQPHPRALVAPDGVFINSCLCQQHAHDNTTSIFTCQHGISMTLKG